MTCLMKYSGCLRNPASVNTWFIPIIYRRSTIPGGAGLRNHPQYHHKMKSNIVRSTLFLCHQTWFAGKSTMTFKLFPLNYPFIEHFPVRHV